MNDSRYEYPFDLLEYAGSDLQGVKKLRNQREWIHEKSELLFISYRLPATDAPTPIFGSGSRKIFWAMHEAGLLKKLYNDPLEAERAVFAVPGIEHKNDPFRGPWSVVSWADLPVVLGNRRSITVIDWERILEILQPLGVKKVVLMGQKLIKSVNQTFIHNRDATPTYGHLWEYNFKGYPVSFYGLPITKLNEGALVYYEILKEEVPF